MCSWTPSAIYLALNCLLLGRPVLGGQVLRRRSRKRGRRPTGPNAIPQAGSTSQAASSDGSGATTAPTYAMTAVSRSQSLPQGPLIPPPPLEIPRFPFLPSPPVSPPAGLPGPRAPQSDRGQPPRGQRTCSVLTNVPIVEVGVIGVICVLHHLVSCVLVALLQGLVVLLCPERPPKLGRM